MEKDPTRLDANESAFFSRQLEYVKTQTYDTKYAPLRYSELIPISFEAPSGADQITFRSFTRIGEAKFISDFADDFPSVDVFGEETTVKIKSIGASYSYSIKEIRRAQVAGLDLDSKRVSAALRAVDQVLNRTAWLGDTKTGLVGLLNNANITEYTVPDGAGAGPNPKTWPEKTPDEIVADLSNIVSEGVVNPTNGQEIPDTILLPLNRYNLIQNTRMTDGDSSTIMKFFMDNNQYIKRIDWLPELSGAGAGGTNRYITYPNNSNSFTFEIPQAFEMFAEDKKGMSYQVPVHAETAGVIVYYPASIAFGDGI